jgi:hypothetical protein
MLACHACRCRNWSEKYILAHRMPLTLRATISFFCLLSLCSGLTSQVSAQRRVPPPFKIAAITAKLFDELTGIFSPDLLTAPDSELRNRRTGPGSSNSMMIVVELAGQAGSYAPDRKLLLTATDSRRVLLKRSADIKILSDEGKYYLAFWIYDIGCYPVTLGVRVTGQSASRAVKKTIPFRCGD